jgi:mutator protein MutT
VKVWDYKNAMKSTLKVRTLMFLVSGEQVLLAMKKRGFGAGRWNGAGGKLEPGETVDEAAIREAKEEIGVTIKSMKKAAELEFYFYNEQLQQDPMDQKVIAYVCDSWEGEPSESEEMAPKWFAKDKLPLESMWPDDAFWLPSVLAGKFVEAQFLFGKDDALIDHNVIEKGTYI